MHRETFVRKSDSMMLKGIAICMMLFHHCFLQGRFESFNISLWPFSTSVIIHMASLCKMCVSIFSFISGYGLYLSYKNYRLSDKKDSGRSVLRQYISSFNEYFFVVLLCWILTSLIDQRPAKVYLGAGAVRGCANAFFDFLGLANLFGTKTINGTWWYMSAAFVFIVFMPLVFRLMEYMGGVTMIALIIILPRLIIGGFPGSTGVWSFMPSYIIGAAFAFYDRQILKAFDRFSGLIRSTGWRILSEFLLLSLTVFLFLRLPTKLFWDFKWGLFPVVFICFFVRHIRLNSPGYRFFVFLGKYASLIFMIHSFYRGVYLNQFIYGFPHFSLVFIALAVLSLISAVLIRGMIRLCRYDRLVSAIQKRIMQTG